MTTYTESVAENQDAYSLYIKATLGRDWVEMEIRALEDLEEEEAIKFAKYSTAEQRLIARNARKIEIEIERVEEEAKEKAYKEKAIKKKQKADAFAKEMKEKGYPSSVQENIISESEFNYALAMQKEINPEFTYKLFTFEKPKWTGWHNYEDIMDDFKTNPTKYEKNKYTGEIKLTEEERIKRREVSNRMNKERKSRGLPHAVQWSYITETNFENALAMQNKVDEKFIWKPFEEPNWPGWHKDPEVMTDFRANPGKYKIDKYNGQIRLQY